MTVSSSCMSGEGARAGSDKPQKLLRFNSAQKLPFVRMRLESIQQRKPFQAYAPLQAFPPVILRVVAERYQQL